MSPWVLLLAAAALVAVPRRRSPLLRVGHLEIVADEHDSSRSADPLAVASTFDLLAACVRAGLPMSTAARAVAVVAPSRLGVVLRRAADLLALGADAPTAWASAGEQPETEALARLARRSARSGAPLAGSLTELATAGRVSAEDAAAARAQRAGVLIGGPLGLCFLPAFVCLGIVPVIVGLASKTFGNGVL